MSLIDQAREEARDVVGQLASDKLANPTIKEDLAGASWAIERTFTRMGHLLLEFIQNAEDAKSRKLMVALQEGKEPRLMICNDGKPFSREDVRALCSIGRSRKSPEFYLGYIGVGFKSAFIASDDISIYSWPFSFRFSKNYWPDPENTPWQITPIWLEEYPDKYKEWNTTFVLVLRPDVIQQIAEQIEKLTSRVLLFTHNLVDLTLKWDNKFKHFTKREEMLKEEPYQVAKVKITEEFDGGEHTSWVVFRSIIDVPDDVSKDSVSRDWKRDKVRKREIAIAFRLDKQGDLLPNPGTLKFGVFSYLPLMEEVYELPFIIHGDFLSGPGRETMHREALWNLWLLDEILRFIRQRIIPEFKSHPIWKYSYTRILYGNAPHVIEQRLASPLRHEMIVGEHILDIKENFVSKANVIKVSENILKSLGIDFIQRVTGKLILHPECKLHTDIEANIPSYSTIRDLVSEYCSHERLKVIFGEEWINTLRWILEALADEWFNYAEATRKSNKYISDYKYAVRVLTVREEACYPDDIWLAPEEFEKHAEFFVPKEFRFLHPSLRTEKILNFLKEIGVKQLELDDIHKAYLKKQIPKLTDEIRDPATKDDRKAEILKQLFEAWRRGLVSLAELRGIPVKTKTGRWLDPQQVAFSQEYQPEHDLEGLIADRFLDEPLEFLDPTFVRDASVEEVSKWREFFEGVGLEKGLRLESFVQRVGVLVSLAYERKRVAEARALDESEARGKGYDIESKMPDGSLKCIEVKARAKEWYVSDLELTRAEYNRMFSDPQRYFVYIVCNALTRPELYVVKGSELAKVLPERFLVNRYDWHNRIAPEPVWRPRG